MYCLSQDRKIVHLQDTACIGCTFYWILKTLLCPSDWIQEVELQHFKGLSFETISSVGANAAIIHYAAKEDSCAELQPDSMYLCDSGGQVSTWMFLSSNNSCHTFESPVVPVPCGIIIRYIWSWFFLLDLTLSPILVGWSIWMEPQMSPGLCILESQRHMKSLVLHW